MRALVKLLAVLTLALGVAACTKPANDSPQEEILNAAYQAPGGPSITLFTTVNGRSNGGAHTAMMINADQRVIWDPAGGFKHEAVPELRDVLYGINARRLDGYLRFQSSDVFYVIAETIPVSQAVAQQAMQLVQARGPVSDAQCALSTSQIMQQLPGFETIKSGWYPLKLHEQIETRPDVRTVYYKTDEDKVVRAYTPAEWSARAQ